MAKDEHLEEKVLYVNRCSKVVKGGRKFSFSALILVGDGHGKAGIGFAKANELADAIKKGGELARKNIERFEITHHSIPHEVFVNCDGAKLMLKPAPEGVGIVAGSKVRSVLESVGIKDIVAKSIGSSNPLNQVRAVFTALRLLRSKEAILDLRKTQE